MLITNGIDKISIGFTRRACDSPVEARRTDLIDPRNAVEIDFGFSGENIGCGLVLDEYVWTRDIRALATGFCAVLKGAREEFACSGDFAYKNMSQEPFFTFEIRRDDTNITVGLTIFDGMYEHIAVNEVMDMERFETVANELKAAAKNFPVL